MGDAKQAPKAGLSGEIADAVKGLFYEFQPSSHRHQNVSQVEHNSEDGTITMKPQESVKGETENDADRDESQHHQEDQPAQMGEDIKKNTSSEGETNETNEVDGTLHQGETDEPDTADHSQNESFEETPYQPEREPDDSFTNGWEFRTYFGQAGTEYDINTSEHVRRVRIYVGGPRIYRKLKSFIYIQTAFMCLILFILINLLLLLGYIAFKNEIEAGFARIGSGLQCFFSTEHRTNLIYLVYFLILAGHAYVFVRVLKNNDRQRM